MIRGTWEKSPLVKKADKEDENTETRQDKPKPQKEKEKEQTEIDKVVKQLAIFKIKQREKKGDEESHEKLSNQQNYVFSLHQQILYL